MQDAKFVQRESPKHGGVIPQAFASRGWFWWTAHLLGVLLQPGPSLARAVAASFRSTGLGAALRDGPVLGMHVRHGDACLAGERVRMARTCSPGLGSWRPMRIVRRSSVCTCDGDQREMRRECVSGRSG